MQGKMCSKTIRRGGFPTLSSRCTSRSTAAKSRRACVFELEQQRDQVKLTVTHDDFAPDSKVFAEHQQRLAVGVIQPQELPGDEPLLRAPWYDKQEEAAS